MIFAYILLFLSILTEVFYIKTFCKLNEIQNQKQTHVVMPGITDTILTPVFFLIFWFLGLFFLSKPDMASLGYLCFVIYALHLLLPYNFLGNIILYDENGFSIGYAPRKAEHYHYDDVTELVSNKRRPHLDKIYIKNERILFLSYFSKEYDKFKDYVNKQRIKREQISEQTDFRIDKKPEEQIDTLTTNDSSNEIAFPIHFHASNNAFNLLIGIVLLLIGVPIIGFVIFTCLPEWMFCTQNLFSQITFLTISKFVTRSLFSLLLATIGSLFIAAGWMLIALEKREILFTKSGLQLKEPFGKWKHISWTALGKICICYEPDWTSPRNIITDADTKLCFLCKGENSFWRSHNLFHYRKIFILPYSEEFLALVKEICPLPIMDKRNSRIYNNRSKSNLH